MQKLLKLNPIKALKSSIINKAALAEEMFPNNKSAAQYLSDKISNRQGKRVTEKDLKKIEEILKYHLTDIV